MSDRYKGAILSPTAPTVTPQSAGGIYTSSQQLQYQGQGVWPQAVNYPINNSLRFRSSASAYLNRTPASATNRTTWTWSGWVKLGILNPSSGWNCIFGAYSNDNNRTFFYTNNNSVSNTFYIFDVNGGSTTCNLISTQVLRDPSAWYHLVVAVDTTQSTSSNRIKVYLNGSQITSFGTASYPSQNANLMVNNNVAHYVGASNYSGLSLFHDGYMAEVNFVDGVALTPSSFGTTDANGIWQPIPYTGSYGTNGFYLPFYNSATLGTSVTANYLIVAGGGSGQGSGFQYVYGGGGGAGGLLTGTTTLNSANNYTITVGAGGSAVSGTDSPGNNGSNSTAFELTAIGGSGGRSALGGGGSGGGAGSYGGGNTSGTSGQGNSGGTATAYGATASGGGGGGAGAAGGNASSGAGGAGGAGTASSISGSSVTYAGGGGGAGSSSGGAGGAGGGGAGAGVAGNGTNGTANTGGGGGAAATTSGGNQTSGAGGSGVVIVSYAGSQRYVGGTVTSSGGNTIHTFTSSGTLTVLGNDFSGNGNNWTLNNISLTPGSTYDSMIDVPTNTNSNTANYCVMNPLIQTSNLNLSNGNLTITGTGAYSTSPATFGMSSGKWYWEYTCTTYSASGDTHYGIGTGAFNIYQNTWAGSTSAGWIYAASSGSKYNNNSATAYGSTFTSGDVIGVAFDADNGTLTFYKNNTSQGTAFTGLTSGPYFPVATVGTSNVTNANFGQRPFSYTPPTGFLPLNTYNLPTPTILAGNQYMDALLYTGNGSASQRTDISWTNIQPDMIWVKSRSNAYNNDINDDVRGVTQALCTNSTAAEDGPVAFGSDGFGFNGVANQLRIFTSDQRWNANAATYVAWGWKGSGAAGVSNTNGTITSTVSANTTAGFSIVGWTGNGSVATLGHGLGVTPSMIFGKRRDGVSNWFVYHASLGATAGMNLNTTDAALTNSGWWNNTAPTSSVFTIGSYETNSGSPFIAYCFSAVSGYSAFGSYTGNGSTSNDGPFVFLGFRPKFIMGKRSNSTGGWWMFDTSRNTFNLSDDYLYAHSADAEFVDITTLNIDILSNGFKVRSGSSPSTWINASGGTYIYMAFAENPFKIARAR
jgi:hypothetical protein